MRVSCEDVTLRCLAEPQPLEDVTFHELLQADDELLRAGDDADKRAVSQLTFDISRDRVATNRAAYRSALVGEGADDAGATSLAHVAASTVSGLALWPRLTLNPSASIVVEARGPCGEHRASHWGTMVPFFASRPVAVAPGDVLTMRTSLEVPNESAGAAPTYTLAGEIRWQSCEG